MVSVDNLVVVKVVMVFPVHLVVSACRHLDHHSIAVVIETVYGKDHHHHHHHHHPVVGRLSACEVHLKWVGLVVEVMMEVNCTVQDCHSYLGHCQAAAEDPVEGRRWCC